MRAETEERRNIEILAGSLSNLLSRRGWLVAWWRRTAQSLLLVLSGEPGGISGVDRTERMVGGGAPVFDVRFRCWKEVGEDGQKMAQYYTAITHHHNNNIVNMKVRD